MTAVGLLLLVAGALVIYEVVKGMQANAASAAALGTTTANNVLPASNGPVMASGGQVATDSNDVAYNVQTLAAWANANGIDPRVALTILAGESGGSSAAFNAQDSNGGSAGPLQINGVNNPNGGQMTDAFRSFVDNIGNALGIIGPRWVQALSGVSYSQFLSDPEYYYDAAQGGVPSVVSANLAASNNYSATVEGWCQQYGVC